MATIKVLEKTPGSGQMIDQVQNEVTLSSIATLLRAPLFKDENSAEGRSFKVLSVIDLKDYGHTAFPGKEIRIKTFAAKAQKYSLKPYDVVISIVGTVGRICIIPEDVPDNWIPTSNMLIIRFKERKPENAFTMVMLLHSGAGRKIMNTLIHGTKISMISKKEFSRIKIPVFSDEMIALAGTLYEREEKLSRKIDEFLHEITQVRSSFSIPV